MISQYLVLAIVTYATKTWRQNCFEREKWRDNFLTSLHTHVVPDFLSITVYVIIYHSFNRFQSLFSISLAIYTTPLTSGRLTLLLTAPLAGLDRPIYHSRYIYTISLGFALFLSFYLHFSTISLYNIPVTV